MSKNTVQDYNRYVEPDEEMWLGEILKKSKQGKYESVEAYRADAAKIELNCRKYNGINGGICANPDVLQQSFELHQLIQALTEHTEETLVVPSSAAGAGGGG